ncbi:GumC family protein [Larkinella sp. VNQ87]|uniref:GumC family protein n=1 Tax=Larkinella sp. VNQ87 TaxID=3400921 RepID=UPI003C066289
MSDNRELFPINSEIKGEKDIKSIMTVYASRWRIFLFSILICFMVAFVYIKYLSTPKYTVKSSVLIKTNLPLPTVSNFVALNGTANFDPLSSLETEVELLKSDDLLRSTLKELSLSISYEINNKEIYSKYSPIKVVGTKLDSMSLGKRFTILIKSGNHFLLSDDDGKTTLHKFGQEVKVGYGTLTILANPNVTSHINNEIVFYLNGINELISKYKKVLKVVPFSEKASLLQLQLIDEFPERGTSILNKLMEIYERRSFETKNLVINNTISFLDERLRYFSKSLSGVERRVEQYKRTNELTDINSQAASYVAQADAYTKNMSEWAIQIDILESIENYLNEAPNQYKLVPSSLGITDPTLMDLINKLNELQLQRENTLRTVKPNSPLVKSINDQISNLRQNILENLKNIKNGLIIQSENYKANSERFRSKVDKVPTMERDLLEINRQQSIRQNIYLFLLQKREESTIAKSAIVPDSEIVDSAWADPNPVSPKQLIVYLVAVLSGLSIPFAYIYIKEFTNDKIRSSSDLAHYSTIPSLVEIDAFKFKKAKNMTYNLQNAVLNKFELIRAKILYSEEFKKSKVLMVTSSKSGEGKTFFSVHLALSLLKAGKKVILVELNLRQPSLQNALRLSQSAGVSNYISSDNHSFVDFIQYPDNIPNLSVISAGEAVDHPSELLMSHKIPSLISKLKQGFDYVIICSSSVNISEDVYVLHDFVDHSLIVVRYNFTTYKDVTSINKVYQEGLLTNPKVIFNALPNSQTSDKIDNKAKNNRNKLKRAYI